MPWNAKCQNGGPVPFNPVAAVALANFANAVYVNTAAVPNSGGDLTRYAYVYVTVNAGNVPWTVCVVGHAHFDAQLQQWVAGNTFIPGWDNWSVATSVAHLGVIAGLQDLGAFPGNNRYPH